MNLKLKKHIDDIIYKNYSLNDMGHSIDHANYVIRRSLEFAKEVENINLDMVYIIAAYHDVGHHINAKEHEYISSKLLLEDEVLKDYFSDEQIKIMSEAVFDHRSSMDGEPRSIYGKIVSSADRNTDVEITLKRCFSYNRKHSPELSLEECIEKCRQFLLNKFGIDGYARNKMYFKDIEYDKYLADITNLANDPKTFSMKIKEFNNIE